MFNRKYMSLKINIVSPGRFHVCDLARELDKNGWDVRFYSFVPTNRTIKFGLPAKCNKTVLPFVLPFIILQKYYKKEWTRQLRIYIQDIITSIYMRKCDILIAMSGDFVHTVRKAKRDGSIIIIERGSKHILEQKKILEAIPSLRGKKPIPNANIKRELEDYQNADYIAVASKHVYESFVKQHFDIKKLFINPYGVDLSMFHPDSNVQKEYDILMVGGWSYRKGCDLIESAIRKTSYNFLHVGGIVDLPFPQGEQFTHINSVDQKCLVDYYNKAKIFLLPSREEGLAMVQAQAIACNLPLIGSKDSGAEDLQSLVKFPQYITLIKDYSVDSVINAIDIAMNKYKQMKGELYAGESIKNLTWTAYGKRYSDFLHKITSE